MFKSPMLKVLMCEYSSNCLRRNLQYRFSCRVWKDFKCYFRERVRAPKAKDESSLIENLPHSITVFLPSSPQLPSHESKQFLQSFLHSRITNSRVLDFSIDVCNMSIVFCRLAGGEEAQIRLGVEEAEAFCCLFSLCGCT